MKIGDPIPRYRVPAFINGAITTSSLRDFQDRWVIVNSVFHFGVVEALFFDRQHAQFNALNATLVVLIQHDRPFHEAWHQRVKNIRPPLLADPSRRLSRILGLAFPLPPFRCETLLVDPQSRIQFRLVHDLNLRMIKTTIDVLQTLQKQNSFSSLHRDSDPILVKKT